MAPSKVLRWFGKSKNEEANIEYAKVIPRKPHKISWVKSHETEEREIRYNNLGRVSANYRAEFDLIEWKKHISQIPPSPTKQLQINNHSRNSAANLRRFGLVEPLVNDGMNKRNLLLFSRFEDRRNTAPARLEYVRKIEEPFTIDENKPKKDTNESSGITKKNLQLSSVKCPTCEGPMVDFGYYMQWCSPCQSKIFEEKFGTWTSGNDHIDSLILESQLASESRFNYLEWIPYDRFKDLTYIGSGGFGSVYHALWLDGPCEKWDQEKLQYVRCGQWKVALKSFNNSMNVDFEFFNELGNLLCTENNSGVFISRCHGITQNPKTKNYMLVTQYAKHGNIRTYYQQNFKTFTWKKRLDILYGIAVGLMRLHQNNLMHKNLHSGNVLVHFSKILLGDFGIGYKAENVNSKISDDLDNKNGGTFGVLPFIAPEILRNKPYTKAADIYSFGTIMWELARFEMPFANRAHDVELAIDICCNDLTPEAKYHSNEENEQVIPEIYAKLIRKCWSRNPNERPSAEELYRKLGEWLSKVMFVPGSYISRQFKEADEFESYAETKTHPDAVYTSRFINFNKSLHQQRQRILFTRTDKKKEHDEVKRYMANESKKGEIKAQMVEAERSDVAAEVYEILNYL
ncbi:2451_t:CDS:2 [Acaulospora colombiana]|uniref:2451_t:CDS:1 n=1 Tax=Acaulospora colombiana TaxID=27376 RepID=A0ACA9MU09_9GLOM|nr:2451_t:CDS:2 [Acaulospora colombiana]